MCVNAEVSIIAFLYCSITSYCLYKRNKKNDRWIAILFSYIGIMQLLEFFMWIDQECSGINQMASKIATIQVVLQPIISFGLVYYINNGNIPLWLYSILMIYILYSIPKIYNVNIKKNISDCAQPCKNYKYGLSWEWTDIGDTLSNFLVWFIFAICLGAPFLIIKNRGYIYFAFIIISWMLATLIGHYRCGVLFNTPSGSFWCLFAIFGPTLAYFVNK